jgi:ribose-phosphate pyrophosphokinase
MILNLDKNFKPITEKEIEFECFIFSGGEPHIKIKTPLDNIGVSISHRLNSFNDFGLLCMAVDAVQRMNGTLNILYLPYFPGARQDRVMITGEPLSVKVYSDIINHFGFNRVILLDPHSEVTPALIRNCYIVTNHTFIQKVIQHIGHEIILISPDAGALKKIYKVSEFLGGLPVVECSKSRNVKSGKLSGFKVHQDDLKNKDCLIVDDICDGGGTFIGLAEELKKKNAGRLYLAVSHGIFSKGFTELEKSFELFFSTNSIKEMNHPKLVQIPFDKIST